jgi:hypothetical protein
MHEAALWHYFTELKQAVDEANAGGGAQPYRRGPFLVTALAGDVELTVSNVSEEDAVLIAAEIRELGVKALLRATRLCPNCGHRVPEQEYCVHCRAKISNEQ